jgi:hypothetical protein
MSPILIQHQPGPIDRLHDDARVANPYTTTAPTTDNRPITHSVKTPSTAMYSPPPTPNYNNRTFASHSNTPNGQVSPSTLFHYHQSESSSPTSPPIVWAEYAGGLIVKGSLIAIVQTDGVLDARYQHVNTSGELMTGQCRSTPEALPDGRLRLHESWRWTSGDMSEGRSVVEEVAR